MAEEDKPVCGPICEICGKPRQWLVPVLVKRENHGRYEMVKIHLCLYHLTKEIEEDEEEPPEENPEIPEDDDDEMWKRWEEENPDGGDDDGEGWSSTIDRVGQSFG
jgi:hypothetical protein